MPCLRLFLPVVCMIASTAGALAQEPWREPQDSASAINDPDRYAWRLFVALNWPADVKQKQPDPSKKFGDPTPGPVVWETWRNARNQAPDTVFPMDGSDPGPWLAKETSPEKPPSAFDDNALQQLIRQGVVQKSNKPLQGFDEPMARARRNEVESGRL